MSTHLETLYVQESQEEQKAEVLSSLVFGDGGNGAVARLLRNPQNQLRKLDLSWMSLTDYHFMALAQLLPTSRLEKLDVSNNDIQANGLLELARQLPRISTLKKIRIQGNPCCARSGCHWNSETLKQGFMGNTSLLYMDVLAGIPQAKLFLYFVELNRAGRRILNGTAQSSVPDGLLPYLLAGTNIYMHDGFIYYFLRNYPRFLSFRCVA
jgi:hypothetical protein